MYPIDNSSAATTQPTLSPPGTQGYYTAGNMALSVAPTTINQDALNIIQNELDNLVMTVLGSLNKADQTQVLKAIRALIRTRLTAATTFYVNASTGNDTTGNGSSGAPWATPQHAANVVQNLYDLNGFNVIFSCSGNFTGGIGLGFPFVGQANVASVIFDGGGSAQINITNGNCVYSDGASVTVQNFALLTVGGSTGSGDGNIIGVNSGIIQFNNCNFGTAVGTHLAAFGGGAIIATGNYTISGSATFGHIAAETLGNVRSSGDATYTVTVSGTPNFPNGFVIASGGGVVNYESMAFSGSATGSRYTLSNGGIILTNGGGANYFPGNAVGTNADGTGIYS